jgi:hypothetical protein
LRHPELLHHERVWDLLLGHIIEGGLRGVVPTHPLGVPLVIGLPLMNVRAIEDIQYFGLVGLVEYKGTPKW